MKTIWIFLLFISAILISCEKNDNSGIDSIIYKSSFSTDLRPIAITTDKNNGYVYLANHNPSITNFSSKIQKFNLIGVLQETIIDFASFNSGLYDKYSPIDLCINNSDLFVLVKPMLMTKNEWSTYTGFCVLHFNLNGNLINEFDFAQLDNYWDFSAMSFFNDFIYVTSGEIVIKKIDANSGEASDIQIPITNDKSYFLVTDMIVDSEENIYLTGQGPWGFDSTSNDVSICYITQLDCIRDESQTFYSKSRTGIMAAMPNNPGLAKMDNGNIYLSTFYGRSLEIYNTDNELILQKDIKTNEFEETLPIDVTLFDDDIYIVDYKNNKVHIYHKE